MSGRDLALTGVPRSGTTLCCHLLGRAHRTVALFEPMEVARLPRERSAALEQVAAFYADSRASLVAEGTAWSQQVDGRVPDNPFASHRAADGRRRHEAERGRIRLDAPMDPGFALVVKHNAAFTALLPELADRFQTCAIVRNPLAVLASWHSVDLPVSHGRLPAGEHFDPGLARRLDAEPDRIARQLLILDWLFARYGRYLPPERVLAYEEVVASGGAALAAAFGLQLEPQPLRERNASRLYSPRTCEELALRLQGDRGAWRSRYGDADVEALLQRMRGEAP
ncbi:hypothetical protein B1992_06805 [Pseudoxanthomonas broegbernensis]|uniref:Sulfotransferase family protein n=1 Tax=Pseudoxanthomonas broegbernensis TaxID=83619 RepID=A0A7V8K797_9GAMM|nr:hypothetical protein [Pseudoxanthomonas broegbernensis]KAF1686615.1 hypothetical protein B1992_06805 [Pseudoxanthomonas broegbernensis]MBB6063633.1 hypothetical protein [Pseudoxanthomonas broegbernensis]